MANDPFPIVEYLEEDIRRLQDQITGLEKEVAWLQKEKEELISRNALLEEAVMQLEEDAYGAPEKPYIPYKEWCVDDLLDSYQDSTEYWDYICTNTCQKSDRQLLEEIYDHIFRSQR